MMLPSESDSDERHVEDDEDDSTLFALSLLDVDEERRRSSVGNRRDVGGVGNRRDVDVYFLPEEDDSESEEKKKKKEEGERRISWIPEESSSSAGEEGEREKTGTTAVRRGQQKSQGGDVCKFLLRGWCHDWEHYKARNSTIHPPHLIRCRNLDKV